MQFKIDENLPIEIAQLLLNAGFETKTVNDQKLKDLDYHRLINICKKENRVLITLDTDFSDITAYPPQEYPGIIVLRIGSQAKHHILEVFQRVIPLIGVEPINKSLWIVEENIIRVRGKD